MGATCYYIVILVTDKFIAVSAKTEYPRVTWTTNNISKVFNAIAWLSSSEEAGCTLWIRQVDVGSTFKGRIVDGIDGANAAINGATKTCTIFNIGCSAYIVSHFNGVNAFDNLRILADGSLIVANINRSLDTGIKLYTTQPFDILESFNGDCAQGYVIHGYIGHCKLRRGIGGDDNIIANIAFER